MFKLATRLVIEGHLSRLTSFFVLTRDGDRDGILVVVNYAFDIVDHCYGLIIIHSLK